MILIKLLLIVIALTSSIAYGPKIQYYYDEPDNKQPSQHDTLIKRKQIMVPKYLASFYIKQYGFVLINLSFSILLPVTHCEYIYSKRCFVINVMALYLK